MNAYQSSQRFLTGRFAAFGISVCVVSTALLSVVIAADRGDSKIAEEATNLKTLHLVTEQPHPMLDSTITFCRPAGELPHNIHDGYLQAAFCNVYVNDLAKPTMLSGQGVYAIGSLIVKSKLQAKDKPDIELYTVMRKMEKDFDRENGDWEYSVVDGRSRRVYSRGKIDSCIDCHAAYRETDFVTRTYFDHK